MYGLPFVTLRQCYHILTAECLSQVGPLMTVVVYIPTEDSNEESKEQFNSELDGVMHKVSGLTMVMGDFNVSIGESVNGVVGPPALGRRTSGNGERILSFATVHGMCVTNTFFSQQSWYPPSPRAQPSLKDYVLVRQRMRPSVLDTQVFRREDTDSDQCLEAVDL